MGVVAVQLGGRSLTCSSIGEGSTRAVGFLQCWGQGPAVVLALRWRGHRTGGLLTSCGWSGLHLSGGGPLELGVRPSSSRARWSWNDVGLGKGHRGQSLGRGTVPMACGLLTLSG